MKTKRVKTCNNNNNLANPSDVKVSIDKNFQFTVHSYKNFRLKLKA